VKTEHLRISNKDKLALISNFATMITAGIPITEVIDSLLEDAKGNQKKLLEAMNADLNQGMHVHQTMAKFPNVFDKVSVNIVKASEEAGTLDTALKDLTIGIRKDIEFSDKVKAALTYPLFIMLVFVGVLLMILVVVVPKIATVFSRLNVTLPLPTKIMIFASDILLTYTIPLIIAVVAIAVGLFFLYRLKQQAFIRALFSLPLVNKLAVEIDMTRFTHSMHLLLSSGVPITGALDLSSEVVVMKNVQQSIRHAKEAVAAGKKLTDGFKEHKGTVPGIIVKIIEAGEKTGSLEKAMGDASEYLDYEVTGTLKTLTALLEPIMLVLVGILVGGMMLAIIAPIYGLVGQIGAR
jgi:type IV pilus assembly protein PilC